MPTYTYSGDPSTSTKDAVRFLCQDTDVTTAGAVRLSDQEINWLLTLNSNVFLVAAQCADEIAAYWARITNTWIGPLKIERSQMVPFYQAIAEKLRHTASRWSNSAPVFYPTTNDNYQNTNNGNGGPQHIFQVGMDDFPAFSMFWPPADLPPLTSYL